MLGFCRACDGESQVMTSCFKVIRYTLCRLHERKFVNLPSLQMDRSVPGFYRPQFPAMLSTCGLLKLRQLSTLLADASATSYRAVPLIRS